MNHQDLSRDIPKLSLILNIKPASAPTVYPTPTLVRESRADVRFARPTLLTSEDLARIATDAKRQRLDREDRRADNVTTIITLVIALGFFVVATWAMSFLPKEPAARDPYSSGVQNP